MCFKRELMCITFTSILLISGCLQGDGLIDQILGAYPGDLKGTVTIGPLCPVEPCGLPSEQVAQVYEARKVIVYRQSTGSKVAEKNLSANGKYAFSLTPGTYIVDVSDAQGNALPLDGNRLEIGNAKPQTVEIKSGETLILDFDIDTGIR